MVNDWNELEFESLCVPGGLVRGPFGGALKKDIFVSSGYKVYEQRNAIYKTTKLGTYCVPQDKYDELSRFSVSPGDFIVSCSGTIGRIYELPSDAPAGVINQALLKVTLDKDAVDSAYFYQYFVSDYFQSLIIDDTQGGAMKNLVGMDKFRKVKLLCPSLPEQRLIAKALSDMDGYIVSLEKLIAKKKAIKQGAMQELLMGKRRLPGFYGEWISCNLPEVLTDDCGIKIGPFGSQLKKEYLVSNGIYRVYGQENVYQNDFSFGSRYITKERFENLKSCEIKPGDFLISTMGTIGKCALVPSNICVGIMDSHLIRLRIDRSILLPMYLLHLFSSDFHYLENQTSRLSVGGIMDGLSTRIVCALEIKYPKSIDEQTAIATILSDMDNELEALITKLEKTKLIKQGMMQELLTGRIRLLKSESNIVKLPITVEPVTPVVAKAQEPTTTQNDGHNKHFDDAVMIAGIVDAFYSDQYRLGRKKVQKLLYLLRRHQDASTEAFKKKAAGPYADEIRYRGGEPIAIKSQYVDVTTTKGKGSTFTRGKNVSRALDYINRWGKQRDIAWLLDKFKYTSVDDLELLATVDMAICDLEEEGTAVSVISIIHLIATNKEWKAKLKKKVFADSKIAKAISDLQALL